MKTWQAALAHVGTTALQAVAAVNFFDNNHPTGLLANAGVQIGVQTAFSALQLYMASKNSNTDPNGKPLVQTVNGDFVTKRP